MTEPKRLLNGEGLDSELRLLRAWEEQGPSPASMRRAAAALGIASLVTHATATAVASTAVATSGTAAGTAATHASGWLSGAWLSNAWLKGTLLGGLALVTGSVVVIIARQAPTQDHSAARQIALPTLAASDRTRQVDPSVNGDLVPNAPAAIEATPKDNAPSVPSRPREVAASAPASDMLTRELQALDVARLAIRGGNPARGLALLSEYTAAFPRGVLTQEAVLLRIEALLASGRRDEARQSAQALLTASPATPHRARLETLVGPL